MAHQTFARGTDITDHILGYNKSKFYYNKKKSTNFIIVCLHWQSLCHVDIGINRAVVQNSPTDKILRKCTSLRLWVGCGHWTLFSIGMMSEGMLDWVRAPTANDFFCV